MWSRPDAGAGLPLHGPDAQARTALRHAGIIATVKSGRVGNSVWGRHLGQRHQNGFPGFPKKI